MSPRNNSGQGAPPPVMTKSRAFLPVCVAGIFDFLGFIFALFGIFAPLFAGLWASNVTGSAAAGVVAGGVTAFFGGAGLQMFGMIMAMVIGFLGWMVVGFIMLASNRRIFKGANTLMFGSVLLIDEIPFLNILPALSYRTIRMYRAQIKADKKALAEYEENQKQQQIRAQQQAVGQRNQQLAEQHAMNDEIFAQGEEQEMMGQEAEQQAANDAIHEEEKLAA